MLHYIFKRLFAREIIRTMDSKGRIRASEKFWKEQRQEAQNKRTENLNRLSHKISLANDFLRDSIKFEQMVEDKMESIKRFFEINGNNKGPCMTLFLTTPQKKELLKSLNIRPVDWISEGSYRIADEASTIAFILENTETFMNVKRRMSMRQYHVYVNATFPTLYFMVSLEK